MKFKCPVCGSNLEYTSTYSEETVTTHDENGIVLKQEVYGDGAGSFTVCTNNKMHDIPPAITEELENLLANR